MEVGNWVRTIIGRILLIAFFIIYTPFFCATSFINKERLYKSKLFFFFGDILYRFSLWVTFLPITIVGKENIPDGPVIFVGNHQSSLDIPILGLLAGGRPHVWLATIDLMKSFFLRRMVKAAVLVDMSSPLKGMRSLLQAIKIINDNKTLSVMIFPEGGRFNDGSVHDFFSGFAILAEKTGLPVVPVHIFGAGKAYPPKTFLMRRIPVKVIIGKPFVYQEGQEIEQFKDQVQSWFAQHKED